jgi:hypothetical protein
MYKRYGDRVAFLGVYVREAHPTDGWLLESNSRIGIAIKQPVSQLERFDVAEKCCTRLTMSIPLVVDELDDRVGRSYSGMPDRLYLIDRAGRVAYKGGRGPYGFKPAELEQSVILMLQEESTQGRHADARAPSGALPRSTSPRAARQLATSPAKRP